MGKRTDYSFKKGKGKAPTFVMLTHQLFESAAYRHLTCQARALYGEVRYRYNGHNNGRITLAIREAAAALNCSKSSAARSFDELIDHGFIERLRPGVLVGRQAAEWAITEVRNDVTAAQPTRAFLKWLPTDQPRRGSKKRLQVPPTGHQVPPPGRNGSGIPVGAELRPTHGTQPSKTTPDKSHQGDTYRYLPDRCAGSRVASPEVAQRTVVADPYVVGVSEGEQASGPIPISEALARTRIFARGGSGR